MKIGDTILTNQGMPGFIRKLTSNLLIYRFAGPNAPKLRDIPLGGLMHQSDAISCRTVLTEIFKPLFSYED